MTKSSCTTHSSHHVLLQSVPDASLWTVLGVVNAEMSAHVARVESAPAAAVAVTRQLDVASAVELVGHTRSPLALERMTADGRKAVKLAAIARAASLGVALCVEDVEVVNLTRDALASGSIIARLAAIKHLDIAVLREWAETEPDAAAAIWSEIIKTAGRVASRDLVVIALELNLPVAAGLLCGADAATALDRFDGTKSVVGTVAVQLLELAYLDGFTLCDFRCGDLSEDARVLLEQCSFVTQVACGVVDCETLVAALQDLVDAPVRKRFESVSPLCGLMEHLVTQEHIAAAVPYLSQLSDRWEAAVVAGVWLAQGALSASDRIEALSHMASDIPEILAEPATVQLVDEEIPLVISKVAAMNNVDVIGELVGAINTHWENPQLRLLLECCLRQLPMTAMYILDQMALQSSWSVRLVLAKAGEAFGENQAAWAVFLAQVESFDGLFGDLVDGALAGTTP
jgi:hypothetical protein